MLPSTDKYVVLPLSFSLDGIKDREENPIKPIVPIYFPVKLLEKMGWTKETPLVLSVEKDHLKIMKSGDGLESVFFDIDELTYELDNYE